MVRKSQYGPNHAGLANFMPSVIRHNGIFTESLLAPKL